MPRPRTLKGKAFWAHWPATTWPPVLKPAVKPGTGTKIVWPGPVEVGGVPGGVPGVFGLPPVVHGLPVMLAVASPSTILVFSRADSTTTARWVILPASTTVWLRWTFAITPTSIVAGLVGSTRLIVVPAIWRPATCELAAGTGVAPTQV